MTLSRGEYTALAYCMWQHAASHTCNRVLCQCKQLPVIQLKTHAYGNPFSFFHLHICIIAEHSLWIGWCLFFTHTHSHTQPLHAMFLTFTFPQRQTHLDVKWINNPIHPLQEHFPVLTAHPHPPIEQAEQPGFPGGDDGLCDSFGLLPCILELNSWFTFKVDSSWFSLHGRGQAASGTRVVPAFDI